MIETPTPDALGTPQWYALRTRSNREKAVRDSLRTLKVQEFLPLYSEESRWTDRVKSIERPLFTGYVFARFNFESHNGILRLAGVVNVLDTNARPCPIPDEQIDNLQLAIASKLKVTPCEFLPDEPVLITEGAFAGLTGVVIRTKAHVRLVVSIQGLHRSVSVEVPAGICARPKA